MGILVVIPSSVTIGTILDSFKQDYHDLKFKTVKCSQAYDSNGESPYSAVIELTTDNMKYDLLFITSDAFNIMSFFGFYPLSIQKIAQDFVTDKIYKDPEQESEQIFIYHDDFKFIDKYKKYYPDREFVSKTNIILENTFA